MSWADKRAHARYPCKQRIKIKLADGRELAGETIDVSEGGISARLEDALPEDAACVTYLSYFSKSGKARTLVLQCTVRNRILTAGTYRHGLAFSDLTPEDHANLTSFIEALKLRLPTEE